MALPLRAATLGFKAARYGYDKYEEHKANKANESAATAAGGTTTTPYPPPRGPTPPPPPPPPVPPQPTYHTHIPHRHNPPTTAPKMLFTRTPSSTTSIDEKPRGWIKRTPGSYTKHSIRLLQFVLGLTVAGLYGVDLNAARRAHAYADPSWVYAEVLAGLSCLTAALLCVPALFRAKWLWAWEWLLFVLWVAQFGTFGRLYLGAETGGRAGVQRMKNAVWVDLTCMLLWCGTAVMGTAVWWCARRRARIAAPSQV